METAVSLPDALFEEAERYAEEKGLSRSELYQAALRAYLETRSGTAMTGAALTAAINEALKDEPNTSDPALNRLQWDVFRKDAGDW